MSVVTSAKLGVGWKVLGYRTHVTRSATLGEQNELILWLNSIDNRYCSANNTFNF